MVRLPQVQISAHGEVNGELLCTYGRIRHSPTVDTNPDFSQGTVTWPQKSQTSPRIPWAKKWTAKPWGHPLAREEWVAILVCLQSRLDIFEDVDLDLPVKLLQGALPSFSGWRYLAKTMPHQLSLFTLEASSKIANVLIVIFDQKTEIFLGGLHILMTFSTAPSHPTAPSEGVAGGSVHQVSRISQQRPNEEYTGFPFSGGGQVLVVFESFREGDVPDLLRSPPVEINFENSLDYLTLGRSVP